MERLEMNQNNFQSRLGKLGTKKRRAVAEVISTLLLVVITVVGAVILTTFIDESFVAGSLAVTSGTDTTVKTIRLLSYDTRNGDDLMATYNILDNIILTGPPDTPTGVLCRISCNANPETAPTAGGSDFMLIQIENRSVNPIYLKNIDLDGVDHSWDADTRGVVLDTSAGNAGGEFPSDGQFSILSNIPTDLTQRVNQVEGGQVVNLLIKLDTTNENIQLSKTMRVQVNIGENSLADFLIETGDAR